MKKIIETSIRRRVTVAMFTIAILLFGFVSFSRLKMNLLPNLSYPTLTVRTEYPGSAPAEIENLISKPIEEVVGVVKNVHKISSISRSGQSDVMLEFNWGTQMDTAIMEVREKLDLLELPLDIKRPVILRFDPTMDPIMRLGLSTDRVVAEDEAEDVHKQLRRFGEEQLKKNLESATGVAAVKVSGGLEDEIQVLVDQQKLTRLGIPVDTVVNLLAGENINLSGGRLEEGSHQFLVRTLNQFKTIEEMGGVIVARHDNAPIYLRDIAQVRHGHKERQSISRMKGVEAVEIGIYKEGDANTVATAEAVKNRLREFKKELPPGYSLVTIYDQSLFIDQSVREVIHAAIFGGILAIIVLFMFLRHFWTTLIIAMSIPVSVIATFNLMNGFDLTLNIMSLGGIALGIGMLVDNSIVVLENISRYREKGLGSREAAKKGASEVGTAVFASTLTTVAVFFPLVFVKGIAGQLFKDQALTITFALLISLVVAMTLIPTLASLGSNFSDIVRNYSTVSAEEAALIPTRQKKKRGLWGTILMALPLALHWLVLRFFFGMVLFHLFRAFFYGFNLIGRGLGLIFNPLAAFFQKGYGWVENRYPLWLNTALENRGLVLLVAVLMLGAALLLVPRIGVELIPQLAQGELRLEVKLPPGMPILETDRILGRVEKVAADLSQLSGTFAVSGQGNRFDANPDQGGENWGEISMALKPGMSARDEEAVMTALRTSILDKTPGISYKFYRPTLFTFKTPIEVELYGYDLGNLKKTSDRLLKSLRDQSRFADVKSTLEQGHPEVQIRFDREKASALGLNIYEVSQKVVGKLRGVVATRFSQNDRKIDILVRTMEKDRASIAHIGDLVVNTDAASPIFLSSLAEVRTGIGPGEIRRIDQERVAVVSANLRHGDLGSGVQAIRSVLADMAIPDDIVVEISGQNQEMEVSFRSLKLALLLAIFLVYLVMASQFESFLHPFVILFSIPMAAIGAIFALWLTASPISVVVFIGTILLAGIVVNNAIILIDRINQLRHEGQMKLEAIRLAAASRLRPIAMTTLTTVLGLLPMAIGFGEGAEVRAPMAIVVIGGLTVSTLLTLLVIPVLYSLMDRKP
jgi:HAE1 family hydrophobic/amphiphilic exporter-1